MLLVFPSRRKEVEHAVFVLRRLSLRPIRSVGSPDLQIEGRFFVGLDSSFFARRGAGPTPKSVFSLRPLCYFMILCFSFSRSGRAKT